MNRGDAADGSRRPGRGDAADESRRRRGQVAVTARDASGRRCGRDVDNWPGPTLRYGDGTWNDWDCLSSLRVESGGNKLPLHCLCERFSHTPAPTSACGDDAIAVTSPAFDSTLLAGDVAAAWTWDAACVGPFVSISLCAYEAVDCVFSPRGTFKAGSRRRRVGDERVAAATSRGDAAAAGGLRGRRSRAGPAPRRQRPALFFQHGRCNSGAGAAGRGTRRVPAPRRRQRRARRGGVFAVFHARGAAAHGRAHAATTPVEDFFYTRRRGRGARDDLGAARRGRGGRRRARPARKLFKSGSTLWWA